MRNYQEGVWDTLTFILNYLNTQETKLVSKKKLYSDILEMTPKDVLKSNLKGDIK